MLEILVTFLSNTLKHISLRQEENLSSSNLMTECSTEFVASLSTLENPDFTTLTQIVVEATS